MANSFNGNPCNNCECQDGDIFGDNTLSVDGLAQVTKNDNCSHTIHVEAPIFVDSGSIDFTDSVSGNVQTVTAEVVWSDLDLCDVTSQAVDTVGCPPCDGEIIYCFNGVTYKTSLAKLKGYSLL
jgi:hypothetical protein